MKMIIYYKINGEERYNMQDCGMRSPFNNHDRYVLWQLADWHLFNYRCSKTFKEPCIIEDCGWEYPGKDKRYVIMEKHTALEGGWMSEMTAHSRFLTLKAAEKMLKEAKNWRPLMPGPYKFLIKEFSSKRYPNLVTDHKFTQEQVEQKMKEVFKLSFKDDK